jgi:hypothetical protein
LQDKALEDQFYAAFDNKDNGSSSSSSNANSNRPLLFPQAMTSSYLLYPQAKTAKRLLQTDSSKNYPHKKSMNGVKSNHSGGPMSHSSSSSGTGSGPSDLVSKEVKRDHEDESFEGLNLQMVPFEFPSSSLPASPSEQASLLPALIKPFSQVPAKTVSITRIQKYIYKKLNNPASFAFQDIEILSNGIVLELSTEITQSLLIPPSFPISGTEIKVGEDVKKSVIILCYRKKMLPI